MVYIFAQITYSIGFLAWKNRYGKIKKQKCNKSQSN